VADRGDLPEGLQGGDNLFKAALVLTPTDNATHYRLGGAYLADTPLETNDGLWVRVALALKYPDANGGKGIYPYSARYGISSRRAIS
jgi:hypothetical protein